MQEINNKNRGRNVIFSRLLNNKKYGNMFFRKIREIYYRYGGNIMRKRILLFFSSLVLSACIITGCGSVDNSESTNVKNNDSITETTSVEKNTDEEVTTKKKNKEDAQDTEDADTNTSEEGELTSDEESELVSRDSSEQSTTKSQSTSGNGGETGNNVRPSNDNSRPSGNSTVVNQPTTTQRPVQPTTTVAPTTEPQTPPALQEEITTPADASAGSKDTAQGTITLYMFSEPTASEKSTAQSIINSIITPGMSEFDKVKAIHDYIVNKNVYPYPIPDNDYSIFTASAVFAGNAVCQGYADAFSLLCYYANIQAEIVAGTGNGGGHAWNQVRIDNVWYNIDVTWDDPISVDASNQRINVKRYKYFLITDEEMYVDHVKEYSSNNHVCNTTIPKDSIKKEECLEFSNRYYSEYASVTYYVTSLDAAKSVISSHANTGDFVVAFVDGCGITIDNIAEYLYELPYCWSYSYAYSGANRAVKINLYSYS